MLVFECAGVYCLFCLFTTCMAFALHQDLIEKSNDLSHQSKKFYKQAKVPQNHRRVCAHSVAVGGVVG